MKRIFLILMLGFALNATASQTEIKYDPIGNYSYVSIAPIEALGQVITRLCVTINDNAVNTGTIYYELRTEGGDVFKRGNLLLTGEDYDGYATNEYLYNWVANKLSLIL
jgi:hypothetical protein